MYKFPHSYLGNFSEPHFGSRQSREVSQMTSHPVHNMALVYLCGSQQRLQYSVLWHGCLAGSPTNK